MRTTRATLILSLVGTLATAASAQTFSGNVNTLALVSGGSRTTQTAANLAPGQTSRFMRLDNAGPGVTAFGEAYTSPGLLYTRHDVSSIGTPYGQSWGKASYRDAIRWNGPAPITVRMCVRLEGDLSVGGSNPMQTGNSVYAHFSFYSDNGLISQIIQRGKTVEGGWWGLNRGSINDAIVTLRPGKWYTYQNTLQVSGDASDSTRPYTSTYSNGAYTLKVWFEPITDPIFGLLQSGSGHDYTAEPMLPVFP